MALAAVEAEISAWWHDLTGEARDDIQQALDDAKALEAGVSAEVKEAVAQAKQDVENALASAEPGAASDVISALEAKVIAILEKLA
jgi:hypothetical protein